MTTTGLVYHEDYLKHKQIEHHPECPERLKLTVEHFVKTGLMDLLYPIDVEKALVEDVERVHSGAHVEYIKCLSEEGRGRFSIIDPDTYVCPDTYHTALLSAGGVISAAKSVWAGEVDNAFALIRPPGHHASTNQATGFCYFDNAAIAVRKLQGEEGLKKAFIFDWDAHAPNGTMGTFYSDPSVLNISIHQDPRSFFPGQGFIEQTGEGQGKGLTVNFPVPGGSGDSDFIYFIEEFVVGRVRKFKPDMIFISAGQDSHRDDRISQLNVTDQGYATMTRIFMDLADELCDGRLLLELEGGYNLNTLPETNKVIVETLMGQKPEKDVRGDTLDTTIDLLSHLKNKLKASTIWPEAQDHVPEEKKGSDCTECSREG